MQRMWRSITGRSCLVLAAVVIVPFALVWWLDPAVAKLPGILLWRNALPLVLLALLVLALSGRALVTALLTGGLVLAIFRVNAIKELNMNEPLLPGDVVLRHQLANNLEFFGRYLGHSALPWIAAVLGLLALFWLWRLERSNRLAVAPRLAALVVALVGLVTLFHGDGPLRTAYADQHMPAFPLWHPIEGVRRDGLMAGLVRLSQEARVTIPKANAAPVRTFVSAHAQELKARTERAVPAELPDIVIVQSEAFFEPGLLKGVEFGDYAPNFARLSAQGISGALGTPAYGGGTIRTEFETLTGYPVQAFPAVAYPYYGLAASWMPSMPRRLHEFGYETRLLHPFKSSFWNRSQVMPLLGFKHTDYEESFKDAAHAGYYVGDQALFDHVLSTLEKHTDKPQFVMAITMENHGPWGGDVGDFGKILKDRPIPQGLSNEARLELTHYLSHLVNGDRALGDFAARLLARPRWTVLLFYGDHLPSLHHAFQEVGFDDGQPGPAQHTRYVLLSNRNLTAHALDLKAYDLPGLVFDTIGLPEDGYLAIEAEVRKTIQQDPQADVPAYGQVVFNAARLAVNCRKTLTIEARCPTELAGAP
ncbi:LTA synthase family protein [Frateuria sp. YIM B11624]|uniref:LTA synthase family protein n=1 Tax=Frateuria sp. YIM B11624 TaxID=3143185 RepID=UPI003C70C298